MKDLVKDDNGCGVAINSLCSCFDTGISALATMFAGLLGSLLGGSSGGSIGSGFMAIINSVVAIASNIATM